MTLYMTESVLQLNIINSAYSTGHLKGEKMYLDPYILNKLINMIHRPKRKKKKKLPEENGRKSSRPQGKQ